MFHSAVGRSVDHVGFIRALELSGRTAVFHSNENEGNGKTLVRLMADEIATGSGTKVSKRKLKRLQVSRCSWFILSVKSTSLFSHLQRIGVVHFHSYSTANASLVTQFETATVQFIKNQPW